MNDHDHRGEYAGERHDHYDYAERHHRHYDPENDGEKAQRRITALQDEVDGLRGQLADALERIRALEGQTPQARQLQLEADQAAADLAAAGCSWQEDEARAGEPEDICPETSDGYHCTHWQEGISRCCACGSEPDEDQAAEPEPEQYDPGPECDDQGGMSEYRYAITPEEPW